MFNFQFWRRIQINTREKGKCFEVIAKKYLENKNYNILETNFFCKLGEIDIIAAKDSVLVFIEVKARKTTKYGYPREAVTKSKQRKIIKAAKYYIMKNKFEDVQSQFDVIEIIYENKIINHLENAFW